MYCTLISKCYHGDTIVSSCSQSDPHPAFFFTAPSMNSILSAKYIYAICSSTVRGTAAMTRKVFQQAFVLFPTSSFYSFAIHKIFLQNWKIMAVQHCKGGLHRFSYQFSPHGRYSAWGNNCAMILWILREFFSKNNPDDVMKVISVQSWELINKEKTCFMNWSHGGWEKWAFRWWCRWLRM